MYLKSLELHGFKSFPDKTVLNFDKGSTIIVGPNGSGKSNITDAIRWVLGEISNKNIRGSKLEDVIFVGADSHRPMSFAEVSITFDDSEEPKRLNCPYDEVTVTRRYFKAGESEYLINKKVCRLKDIHELFMNTGIGREGYSIIGQGKIAEIISKKSEDRRGIFEETAGISKYRYQKNESERKLRETEDNMNRVRDIFDEIESRVGPLSKEAEKARKYLELYDEKKQLDITLWLFDLAKITAEIASLTEEYNRCKTELDVISDEELVLENQYKRLYESSVESKQSEAQVYETITDINDRLRRLSKTVSDIEMNIVRTKTLIDSAEKNLEKAKSDAEAELASAEEYKAETEKYLATIDEINKEIAEKNSARNKLIEESNSLEDKLSEMLELIDAKENEKSELRVRYDVLKTNVSDKQKRADSVKSDVDEYKTKLDAIEKEIAKANELIASYENKLTELYAKCDKYEEDILSLTDSLTVNNTETNSLKASHDALESRIQALERMADHFEGYSHSVRFIMNASGNRSLDGIVGPISELIHVDKKYITALETAFGSSLQNVVVRTEEDAKAAISLLKREGAGKATFYPVNNVRPSQRTDELVKSSKEKGFVGFADELLSCDSEYRDIISSIVGRTAIFDNIDNATVVAKKYSWKIKIVTLDGQQINIGGSFTGGSVKKDSGMLSRGAEIDKIKEEKAEVASQYEEASAEGEKIQKKIASLQSELGVVQGDVKLTESLLRSELQSLDELKANKGVVENLIGQLISDRDSLTATGTEDAETISGLEASIKALEEEIEKLNSDRNDVYVQKNELDDKAQTLDDEINELNVKLVGVIKDAEISKKGADDALARAEKCKADVSSIEDEIEKLKASIAESEKVILQNKENEDALNKQIEELESRRVTLIDGSSEIDKKLNDNRIRTKEVANKKELIIKSFSAAEAKLDKFNGEKDKITNRMWDEYELSISAATDLGYPEVTVDDHSEKVKRQNELKNVVRSLGNVNVGAIDEYAQVKERYDFLKEQLEDLTKSREELEGLIKSINEEMIKIFSDAFMKINQNFGETFVELFGGGSAQLELTDPDNVLESGVEIRVAPPGKMIKSLSLLSGGEQAFVAIALIFALIKVNPSPFCIFDEIEAALDEVNVTRVANYIKRFSKEMQIILITHRRGTMETADTLYGVTMPQHGVSRVFTLDVNAVAKDSSIARKFTEN